MSAGAPRPLPEEPFRLAGCDVEPSLNRLRDATGVVHAIEPKVMQVLVCLAAAGGRVVTRDELIAAVWDGGFVTDDVVTRAVGQLRRLLGDDPEAPRVIETIRKRGYRLLVAPEMATARASLPPPPAPPAADASPPRSPAAVESPATAWSGRTLLPWLVAALLAGLVACGVWLRAGRTPRPAPALATLPLAGEELRRPRMSPDGTRIAYAAEEPPGTQSLWTVLLAGGAAIRLTHEPGARDIPVAWSADGGEIAFARRTAGDCRILAVPALGGTPRLLTACGVPDASEAAWIAADQELVFARAAGPAGARRLVRRNLTTGAEVDLTVPPPGALGDDAPAVSPDGRTIAFVRSVAPDVDDLWLVPTNGGRERRLTFDHAMILGVDWMADGATLVFSSSRAGLNSLWAVRADGGEPLFVAGADTKIKHPSAARRGDRVVFESWEFDIGLDRVAQDGTHTAIAPGPDWSYQPAVSPDGTRVAFVSTRGGRPRIWTAPVAGGDAVPLSSESLGPVSTPTWSPSGREVAFVARPGGEADVYLAPVEGGPIRRLTSAPGDEVAPSFSCDGQYVYFGARPPESAGWQIARLRLADGRVETVTRDGGYRARESLDGAALYFTRGDRPGLFRLPLPLRASAPSVVLARLGPADSEPWDVGPLGPYVEEAGDPVARVLSYIQPPVEEPPTVAELADLAWPGFSVFPDGRSLVYARVARHLCRFVRLDHPRVD